MTIVETKDIVCREFAAAEIRLREPSSLLGPVGGGMRLKVSREEPQTSEVIDLASRRCLVGSASHCHVRVDEPGVAPIECLIIQGSMKNVVRWLAAPQEFAGDELFEDEVLDAGEPLQIGPVELELLVDEIMLAEPSPNTEKMRDTSEGRLAEYISRLERLELQLAELQQASELTASLSAATLPTNNGLNDEVAATISDFATQLATLQSRSVSDRDLWACDKAELEVLLQSRLSEFDGLQQEVQRLRDELVAVRSEFSTFAAQEDTGERLAEVSQELAERTARFEQQQTNWEHDRGEFQRQLRQSIERIEQFETQLARQNERQAESEAAHQAAEARADRLQKSVDELSQRLAEQQQDHETVRAAWEADRASLESELAETKQRVAQAAAAESATVELRETWDRERTELKGQVAEAILRAEEIQQELEAQRRQWEDQQPSDRELQLDDEAISQTRKAGELRVDREVGVEPHNPMDRLLAGSSLANEYADVADEQARDFVALKPMLRDEAESENRDDTYSDSGYGNAADVASNYYEQAFNGSRPAVRLDEVTADNSTFENPQLAETETRDCGDPYELAESSSDRREEVAFEVSSPVPPVNAADVLDRMGRSSVWSDDESVADDSNAATIADASNSPDHVFAQFAVPESATPQCELPQHATVSEPTSAGLTSAATSDSRDEEESIEAYMARLMNRVRGADDRDELRPVQSNIARSPVTEYREVVKASQIDREPDAEMCEPGEYKPRSQAPELADRMSAMRSLANDSARTAIASHAMRNWSSIMKLKLFVSAFAFVAVIASIIFFWGDPLLMALGSLVGVGVLAFWARNAMTYRKLLLDSLMLETEDGDYDDSFPDEEAACTTSASA